MNMTTQNAIVTATLAFTPTEGAAIHTMEDELPGFFKLTPTFKGPCATLVYTHAVGDTVQQATVQWHNSQLLIIRKGPVNSRLVFEDKSFSRQQYYADKKVLYHSTEVKKLRVEVEKDYFRAHCQYLTFSGQTQIGYHVVEIEALVNPLAHV
jgi:uncharacterized beta-barrel protein YwiB (DUF1934 family)